MFAVIKTGGKQYLVTAGQKLKIEKIIDEAGVVFSFDEVLAVFDDAKVDIGLPMVTGAKVEATVLKQGRARKITNLRFHSKTRYRKKHGHRQAYTEVEIKAIKAK